MSDEPISVKEQDLLRPGLFASTPMLTRLVEESREFMRAEGDAPTFAYLGYAEYKALCDEIGIPYDTAERGLLMANGLIVLEVKHVSHLAFSI